MTVRTDVSCLLSAILAFAVIDRAAACLWFYGTDATGERIELSDATPRDYVERLTTTARGMEYWERRRSELEQSLDANPDDHANRSDLAAVLIRLGKPASAIVILETVESRHPGEYIVASNLGTAYEMTGDVETALEWIEEGLRRNANAHYGTEWVHLAVLRAKQRIADDPRWLAANSILGLDFGSEPAPLAPDAAALTSIGAPGDLESIADDLGYQLAERLSLVPPPDAVAGSLLADLSSLLAASRSLEHAIAVGELAERYGAPDEDLLRRRLTHYRALVAANPRSLERASHGLSMWALLVPAAVLLVLMLVAFALVKKFVRRVRSKP